MEGRRVLVLALSLAAVAAGYQGEGEQVLLVAPVLAPPRDARTHVTDRARQFPVLVLLSRQNQGPKQEPSAKALHGSQQPIYVQVRKCLKIIIKEFVVDI